MHEGVTQSIISILSLLINCVLFTFVAFRVVVEGAPIGDYSLYTSALTNLSSYISTLVASIAAIYEGTLFIDNMMVFMKEKTTRARPWGSFASLHGKPLLWAQMWQ